MDSIGGSESVWGVESDGYGKEGTYSAKEKAEAKRLGKLKVVSIHNEESMLRASL